MRGHFGIGILNHKNSTNIGTLFRSAYCFGANYIYTIGKEYKRDASDTPNSSMHIPYYHYSSIEDFLSQLPKNTQVVCIENSQNAIPIKRFCHPERAVYLLGNESSGLDTELTERFPTTILPSSTCLNVGIAGSIVMFDRITKFEK